MEDLRIQEMNLVISCIGQVREFDGTNSGSLPDFIQQIENILPSFDGFDISCKRILMGFIKNKCIGKCTEALHREQAETWVQVKDTLKRNFGEKQTVVELMDRLKTTTLNGTVENYFYFITKLANRIINRKMSHNEEDYSIEEINRITLQVFRNHLPEPTRTMIITRNPSTLTEAFRIITEARHQGYTQYGPPQYKPTTIQHLRTNFSDHYNNRYTNRNSNYNHNRQSNIDNNNQNKRQNGNYNQYNQHRRDNSQPLTGSYDRQQRYENNRSTQQNQLNNQRHGYNNQNDNTSRNTRRTYDNQTRQSRRLNEDEPMDVNSNFLQTASQNFLT